MGIRIGQRTLQSFAAKEDDESMTFAGFDDDLGITDFFNFGR